MYFSWHAHDVEPSAREESSTVLKGETRDDGISCMGGGATVQVLNSLYCTVQRLYCTSLDDAGKCSLTAEDGLAVKDC